MKTVLFVVITSVITSVATAQVVTPGYLLKRLQSQTPYVFARKYNLRVEIDSQFVNGATGMTIDTKIMAANKGWDKLAKTQVSDIITTSFIFFINPTSRQVYPHLIISTKSGQTKKQKKQCLEDIQLSGFSNKYMKPDSVYGNGNYALILNDTVIDPAKARSKFYSLSLEDIVNIGFSQGYKVAVYGEESKNGVVFIWTKTSK
jgi:hypothetical protein